MRITIRGLVVAAAALTATVAVTACGGNGATATNTPPAPPTAGPVLLQKQLIALPNLNAGGPFTYDIGAADAADRRYYLADRTNKSLDIINLDTFAVRQVTGSFTGQTSSNDTSGPDGVTFIPGGAVYVGDINKVVVVDPVAGAVTATIATSTTGKRTDEGCYDPADNLMMFANGADSPPFVSFISTTTNTVASTLTFSTSIGLEACVYDPGTKTFFLNNDGDPANPNGELDLIPASSVIAGAPTVAKTYPEGACNPSGIDLGPNENLVVACDTPAGTQQETLIMSATSGAIVKTITQVGGEDEVAYDPKANRYYTASRDMTASGISQTGNASPTYTPVVGVIDASTNTWLGNYPTGTGAHSVAVDSQTGNVFVPVPPTSTTGGGVLLFAR